MVSMPLLWSIRFAVDPLLQPKQSADWVKVIEEKDVSETPVSVKFKVHVVDGWYEHDPELEAWIAKDEDGKVYALSPTCKHLGCRVEWNGDPNRFPELFFLSVPRGALHQKRQKFGRCARTSRPVRGQSG